jgi:hypothetical protein
MVARFPAGTFKRMEAVLEPEEDRTNFVRAAVERELWSDREAQSGECLAQIRASSNPTAGLGHFRTLNHGVVRYVRLHHEGEPVLRVLPVSAFFDPVLLV